MFAVAGSTREEGARASSVGAIQGGESALSSACCQRVFGEDTVSAGESPGDTFPMETF